MDDLALSGADRLRYARCEECAVTGTNTNYANANANAGTDKNKSLKTLQDPYIKLLHCTLHTSTFVNFTLYIVRYTLYIASRTSYTKRYFIKKN